MLARQAAVRRATLSAFATQRVLIRQTRPLGRQISFIPWRRSKPASDLRVYFPKPVTQSQPSGPSLRRRIGRVIFTTIVLYSCWQIFVTIVFDPLLDWADAEWETLSEKEKEEVQNMGDEDEPILFLPFPFTTKEVKQPPYKGSDPEWEMFVKVNQDTKLQKEIKFGLADEIKRGVEKNPAFIKLLGGGAISVRKLWLDIIYPPAPPPKHYVAGIIIDEDGIFWGDRPIDSTAAGHLDKVLYPKAVAMTVWTFVNFLFKQTAQDISKALGFNGPAVPEPTWQSVTLDRIKEGSMAGTGKQAVKIAGQPDKSPTNQIPTGHADIIGTLFGGDTQLDPRIQAALQAASLTFARNWKPTKSPPNRGCIRVDGVVELRGKTACMAVYVLGWYDPKLRKYMGIQTGLKHLVQLKQRPAPG
ncbi:Fc.00g020360.m01.CDS01 [Cosmosporella sp. VM-42]